MKFSLFSLAILFSGAVNAAPPVAPPTTSGQGAPAVAGEPIRTVEAMKPVSLPVPAASPTPIPAPQAAVKPEVTPIPKAEPAPVPKVVAHPVAKHKKTTRHARAARHVHAATTTKTPAPAPVAVPAPAPAAAAHPAPKAAPLPGSNVYDEAKNLLIPSQKYLVRYEDEEGNGRPAPAPKTSDIEFTAEQVAGYRDAVQFVADYRGEVKGRCATLSSQIFVQALDQYAATLVTFHRRALFYGMDISENNNVLQLVVNRSALKDATVLVSRYLQFKKLRFQDVMASFLPGDGALVANLVTIAKTLKVELSESDWNRAYKVREVALESISAWPREAIFDATQALSGTKESVCVVELKAKPVDVAALKKETPAG